MTITVMPTDRIARVAQAVKVEEDVLRLANLPEEKLTGIFNQIEKRDARTKKIDRLEKLILVPYGIPAVLLFCASVFATDENLAGKMQLPMALPLVWVMGRGLSRELNNDPYASMRSEINQAALDRGTELNKHIAPKL